MKANDLQIGRVYFSLEYEDEALRLPLIDSYQYVGIDIDGMPQDTTARYSFRLLGSDDRVQLEEIQLQSVLDLDGLVDALRRVANRLA